MKKLSAVMVLTLVILSGYAQPKTEQEATDALPEMCRNLDVNAVNRLPVHADFFSSGNEKRAMESRKIGADGDILWDRSASTRYLSPHAHGNSMG